ncbi:hypothetical protein ASD15_05475 [Massilia sp. Root351]|nr:hypothetical protein ASD15_05475 [Massilia sp. Root351]
MVVQTTYLENLVSAQKATLEAIAATSQAAINAAKDKEEWMVKLLQTIGIIFSIVAAILTYFGITKYAEVSKWLKEIEALNKKARETSEGMIQNAKKVERDAKAVEAKVNAFQAKESALTAKIEKADQAADAFAEKLSEIEQLFTGMHSQKLILDTLRASDQKIKEAHAVLDETKLLYGIAEKHKNERVKSYLAASLSLICMYAELWEEASTYGRIALSTNPRNWDDRLYNLACIYAVKFDKLRHDADKQEAIALVRQYFEKDGKASVAAGDISDALDDVELGPLKDDIAAMALEYGKAYDVARIYAVRFQKRNNPADKQQAIKLLTQYVERGGESGAARNGIAQALADQDFLSVKADIETMAQGRPAG